MHKSERNVKMLIQNCSTLAEAMDKAGVANPGPGYQLHHIVCRTDPAASKARDILEKFGIGINSVANGVYLSNHSGRHISDYSTKLTKTLQNAQTLEEVIDILNTCRKGLLEGTVPLYKKDL